MAKHGLSQHPLHQVWHGMMSRCYKESSPSYKNYGGRGIEVVHDWHDFTKFYSDTKDYWFSGSNLDRPNNERGYGPDNFQFVEPKINQRNRRDNRLITVDGVTKCAAEWAEDYGISSNLLRQRIDRDGLTPTLALTKTCKGNKKNG